MKKSIAILSMALLAGNAYAADVLEAGTQEAPKYYVIKANRGLPFVTFTPDKKNNDGAKTTLYRADELSEYAVWAVIPGSEEGTVNIYNYTTRNSKNKAYMFSFIEKNGNMFDGVLNSGIATTDSKPQDVYTLDNGNGSYGLALMSKNGYYNYGSEGYYGLDATGGDSQFLGNWWSCGDNGTQWWFYSFDDSNGVESGLEGVKHAMMKSMVDEYVGYFQKYKEGIPYVETSLQEGIDALTQLEYSDDYATQITDIWTQYISEANSTLESFFSGKICSLRNMRRADSGKNSYIAVNLADDNYMPVVSMADFNAQFTFEPADDYGGYKLYNANTETYIGASFTPVETEDDALTVYPVLNSNGGYFGISFPFNENKTGNGFNENNQVDPTGGVLTSWSINDGGSIWSVSVVDVQAALNDAISSVKNVLEPYIPNVPESIAEILQAAVDKADELEYDANLAANAEALRTNAIADGNALLETIFSGKVLTLKNLRRAALNLNPYIAANVAENGYWPVASTADLNTQFTFKSVGDGGYKLYNANTETYIGENLTPESDRVDGMMVYPVLNSNGGYYGIAFPFDENKTGNGLNENTSYGQLTSWSINDGGSIWSVAVADEQETLQGAIDIVRTVLEPYIPNVPSEIAEIFQTAINDASNLECDENIVENARVLRDKALADANDFLKNNLGGKRWAIKSANCGYVYTYPEVIEGGYAHLMALIAQETEECIYDFIKSTKGGYMIYSQSCKGFFDNYAYTKTSYYGQSNEYFLGQISSAYEEYAMVAQPILNHVGDYYGISFLYVDSEGEEKCIYATETGLHPGTLDEEDTDAGSIFIITYKGASDAEQDVLQRAVNIVKAALEPYIPNVPSEVAEIFQTAINDASNLEINENTIENAKALCDKAIADGNDFLKNNLGGKRWALKSVNFGYVKTYPAVIEDDNIRSMRLFSEEETEECIYDFIKTEEDGYKIYSTASKGFFWKDYSNSYNEFFVTQISSIYEESAMVAQPILNQVGDYYGISFHYVDSDGKEKCIYATETGLHPGTLAEGNSNAGSIFAIADKGESDAEQDIKQDLLQRAVNMVHAALEPYIPNVPSEVADVFQTAIDDASNLEYNENIIADATALRDNAIADGNDILKNNLGEKRWALKSVDYGYVYTHPEVMEDDDLRLMQLFSNQESEECIYDFIPAEDGGYKIYSTTSKGFFFEYDSKIYNEYFVGQIPAAFEENAMVVQPILNQAGDNYGISFHFVDSNGKEKRIYATETGLHPETVAKRDFNTGSIFAIADKGASTTEIVEVEKAEAVKGIYDLSGRKLSAPVRGINIINGKKILIK